MLERFADDLVGLVSPKRKLQRLRYRHAAEAVDRLMGRDGYEGASRGRRMAGWHTSQQSANAAIEVDGQLLRDRARDLVRNNPWAARGLQVLATNVVGSGIRPQLRVEDDGQRRELEDAWARWAESTDCDAAGQHNFYGLQEQVVRAAAEGGGCLVRRRFRRASDGLEIPMQLELLEVDYLDDHLDRELEGGGKILGGIEFDVLGRLRGYHLRYEHPGDRYLRSFESRFVPASEVLHVFRAKRAGQVLGVTEFAPAITSLKELKELTDAHLVQQKIAACFGALVTKDPAEDELAEALPDAEAAGGEPGDELERLGPGLIQYLNPGEDVKFGDPPRADGLEPMVQTHLRAIASSLGISFEALTNDYRQVPFSAARMSWGESERTFDSWRRGAVVPSFCAPVWRWWADARFLATGQEVDVRPTWSSPRRLMLDPVKEATGAATLIDNGLLSRDEWWRQHGYEPDRMRTEVSRDRERQEKPSEPESGGKPTR